MSYFLAPGWHKHALGLSHEVIEERFNQLKKFGVQHHRDWGLQGDLDLAEWKIEEQYWKRLNDSRSDGSWTAILMEEICEAIASPSEVVRREELVQSAAVIFAWIEDIDNRNHEEPVTVELA